MTVGNPESFKIQIKSGREEVDNRIPCDFSNLTLKKLFAWIDAQTISTALKAELKKSASGFPHQALKSWQNNFDKYLSKAQARLRKKREDAKLIEKSEIEEIEEILEDEIQEKGIFVKELALPKVSDLSSDFDDALSPSILENDSVDSEEEYAAPHMEEIAKEAAEDGPVEPAPLSKESFE